MIPGLCCATCQQSLRTDLARRTDAGYVHTYRCASPVALTDGQWVPTGRGTMVWVDGSEAAA